MRERFEVANGAESTETLENMWKNTYSRISQTMRVNCGHIEKHNKWINLLEISTVIHTERWNDKEYCITKIFQLSTIDLLTLYIQLYELSHLV